MPPCPHLLNLTEVEPTTTEGCEDCLKTGDTWVHLRLCMACGHVGCCNDSVNRHASGHFQQSGHGVIQSFEPGEDWAYCYPDDQFLRAVEPHLARAYA